MSSRVASFPVRAPLALAVSLACGVPAVQADDTVLSEVNVTAAAEGYAPQSSRTALRGETLLVDTPQSVSVVTQQQVRDQAAVSLADAARYTPGLTFAQGEGNRDQVVIRGSNTTSDFFVDGIRDDVQYYRDLYNLEQLEIIKGANALAFGRGASGGAINRVLKQATFSPTREVILSGGMFDQYRATLDVGGALSERVAARVNLMSEESGSFRDGVELRRAAINPTLTFRVTNRTTLIAGAEYLNDYRIADRGIPSQNGRPFATSRSRFFGNADESPAEVHVNAGYVQLQHAFNDRVSLSNRTRFAQYDKYYANVYAASAVSNAGTLSLENYRDETFRENFTSQTDVTTRFTTGFIRHQLTAGVDIERQRSENRRDAANFVGTTVTGGSAFRIDGISAASPVARLAGGFNNNLRRSETDVDVLSVYLQDTLSVGERWQVVLGLRQDRFETDFTDLRTAANSARVVDSELSPRAAVVYKPTDNTSIYASYSQTFVPRAGDQLIGVTNANQALAPEEFQTRELGAKWLVNNQLTATAAVFRTDRSNVINPITGSAAQLIDGARVEGVELELQGQLTERLSSVVGYAFIDSEIRDGGTNNGNELYNTARNAFSWWNRYAINDRVGVALGVLARDRMFANDDNRVVMPGYARFDAAAYYQVNEDLKLQLNVENLTDREYIVNAHNNNNLTPGTPLSARVTASYRF